MYHFVRVSTWEKNVATNSIKYVCALLTPSSAYIPRRHNSYTEVYNYGYSTLLQYNIYIGTLPQYTVNTRVYIMTFAPQLYTRITKIFVRL